MISLVVKANRHRAARAAADHNIPFAFSHTLDTYTIGYTGDEHLTSVVQWLSEAPHEAPFPEGTLLIYSHHAKAEHRNAK